MTNSHAALRPAPGDVDQLARGLTQDLAVVSGLVSEIATCWRRAQAAVRQFPADRPVRLQDAVRQIGADIRSLAEGNPEQRAGLALSVAGRFTLLAADIAAAQSMTQVAGVPRPGTPACGTRWLKY